MAQTDANVLVGACTVDKSAYVSNAGAGSFTEVGHTSGPVEITKEAEYYEPESEQSLGPVLSKIQKLSFLLKIPAMEATSELFRWAMEQSASQVSGTAPNKTVAVADPTVEYSQIKLTAATAGLGTNTTRTWTFWKCKVVSVEPIQIGRNQFQSYNVTCRVYRDSSVATPTTNGYFFKQVDS